MSLASTLWFYALREGPPTCLRKGRQITRTDHECLWWWNCMHQIFFFSEFIKKVAHNHINWLQNGVGFQLKPYSVRLEVAKLQESIPRIFPREHCAQISTYPETRGPCFFASTTCHTRQLSPPHSTVSHHGCSVSSLGTYIKRFEKKKLICSYYHENCIWNWCSRVGRSLHLTRRRCLGWT